MSKVVSSTRETVSNIVNYGGFSGFTAGPRLSSNTTTQKTVYTSSSSFFVPAGVISIAFKVWGAGGHSGSGNVVAVNGGSGGGGGFALFNVAAVPNDNYFVSIGASGSGGAGGTGSFSGGLGGAGGGMSMVHLKSGANFIVKAVAGGGAGGSASQNSGSGAGGGGGGGGRNGETGAGGFFCAGKKGEDGLGGRGGSGNNGSGSDGVSFVDTVTALASVGGGGGAGISFTITTDDLNGGGGGAGRGGGGGAAGTGGGGGGGNYSADGSVTAGGLVAPGNKTDPDYQEGIGVGGIGNNTSVTPGTDGMIAVIYTVSTQRLFLPDESTTAKAASLNVSAANNILAGTAGDGGDLFLNAGAAASTTPATKGTTWLSGARFLPINDNLIPLGGASNRWSVVFAGSGTINTSDRREKTDIEPSELGLNFVNMLKPVRYKFLEGKRPHYGFIAQDVKETIDALNVDFGGYVVSTKYRKDPDTGDDIPSGDTMGLRYDEMIAPLTKAVQELSRKNRELAKAVQELSRKHNELVEWGADMDQQNSELFTAVVEMSNRVNSIVKFSRNREVQKNPAERFTPCSIM